MNQTSILQGPNDISIRIDDQKSQRIQQQQQQQQQFSQSHNNSNLRKHKSKGNTPSLFSSQPSTLKNPPFNGSIVNNNNATNPINAQTAPNGSQVKVNVRDTKSQQLSYQINQNSVMTPFASPETATAFDMRTTTNAITIKTNLQYAKLMVFLITQFIGKFFFFTLFLFSLPVQALQIVLGIIYGVASAFKYFVFLYTFNLNLSQPAVKNSESEDDSLSSVKLRFCNQCQEKVNLDCIHCESCKKCVYRKFFHSSVVARCITHKNLMPIEVVVGINLCEGIAEAVVALLAVAKIFTNEDSFKSSAIRIYRNSSGGVLIGITLTVLAVIVFAFIANVVFFYSLRRAAPNKKERKPSTPKDIPQMKIGPENMRGSVSPQNTRGQRIGAITSTLRQHSQLQNLPSSQIAQNGSIFGGSRDKRQFESHWKINQVESKVEDQIEQASMNSFGTIFNFINKKMVSCENIDKQISNSPAKSVKSLSAMDQQVFKTRQKSQNFSEIEIGFKHSPERADSFNNPLSVIIPVSAQYHRKRGTLKSNGTRKSLPGIQQNIHRSIVHLRENETVPNRKKSEDSLKGIPGLSSLQPIN